jgi:hypothetical protein
MGELSFRVLVLDSSRVGGVLEVLETSEGAGGASRLFRASSACSALTLDFNSSTLRPLLLAEDRVIQAYLRITEKETRNRPSHSSARMRSFSAYLDS